ncbi:hypothetical protein CC78DRAFT_588859 [Lojkania enalia]|uniref:DUF7730 domain-containing protein n=1 Tax=Lojkania enalia TaxID=147567 RepID=A0A9P4ND01_9PLEO|nr:hypothetical protein CC78DRAFT_588859 [Didymosphaeria enalia]
MTIASSDDNSPPDCSNKKRKGGILNVYAPHSASPRRWLGPTSIPEDKDYPGQNGLSSRIDKFRASSAVVAKTIHGMGISAFKQSYRNNKAGIVDPGAKDKPSSNSDITRSSPSNSSAMFARALNGTAQPEGIVCKASKIQYMPKEYTATTVLTPPNNVLGNWIPLDSELTRLWKDNQTTSPFLKLPAEVRNRIYEYLYGGKTIAVGFDTYKTIGYEFDGTTAISTIPVFTYYRMVFNRRCNPLDPASYPHLPHCDFDIFIVLSLVCRQLYHETVILPYKLNRWVFDCHNTMFNFLFMERKLCRQYRKAVAEIVVREELPGDNLVQILPGLKKVLLVQGRSRFNDGYRKPGWYRVQEGAWGNRKLVFVIASFGRGLRSSDA